MDYFELAKNIVTDGKAPEEKKTLELSEVETDYLYYVLKNDQPLTLDSDLMRTQLLKRLEGL